MLPAAAATAALVCLAVVQGAGAGRAVVYLAYELGFVLVPGWLVYRALSSQPGDALRRLAFGWGLGYVLAVLAFMLSAATGARGLFLAYPPAVSAAALAVAALRRRGDPDAPRAPGPATRGWQVAAVCVAAAAYFSVAFAVLPLPGAGTVRYFLDYPWTISVAAEARHHWPIQDPQVAGEPLPYHYFVHVHLAAASQVTGLDLPLLLLRLFALPLVAVLVAQLVVAGRALGLGGASGLLAACLAVFVGELAMDHTDAWLSRAPFLPGFTFLAQLSPSFLFGLVVFVPLVTLLGERLASPDGPTAVGDWVLIGLFAVGAADAKVVILPLVAVALLLHGGWAWVTRRRVPRAAGLAAALVGLVAGCVYLLQYRGHSSDVFPDPLGVVALADRMAAVVTVKQGLLSALPGFPGRGALLTLLGIAFGAVGFLAAKLIGLPWAVRSGDGEAGAGRAWLAALLAAGVLATIALNAPDTGGHGYFLFYGLVAGYLLSAHGLVAAWRRRPPLRPLAGRLAALGAGWALAVAALTLLPLRWRAAGPGPGPTTYLLWYGGLVVTLALLYAGARRWAGPTRWPAGALVCAALLALAVVNTPIQMLRWAGGSPSGQARGRAVSPGLHRAFTWIRANTAPDAVIAVSSTSPVAFEAAAFAERRVFLGGWAYAQRSREIGTWSVVRGEANPFTDRLATNRAAFARADRRALGAMARRGVRYLVVVRGDPPGTRLAALRAIGAVVHESPSAVVVELDPARLGPAPRRRLRR